MTKKCSLCLWNDQCYITSSICAHFTPINDEPIESDLEDLIERERFRFYEDWFEYIAGWADYL